MAAPPKPPRIRWIGEAALSVAVVAMAIDHLVGTEGDDEGGLADPAMFAISVALCGALAIALFGWLVPRVISRGNIIHYPGGVDVIHGPHDAFEQGQDAYCNAFLAIAGG